MTIFDARSSRAKRPCPIWVDAFQRDTQHLEADEVGAYFLILMAMWTRETCDFPDDDHRLARVSRVSDKKWMRIKPSLAPYFDFSGGMLTSKYIGRQMNGQGRRQPRPSIPDPLRYAVRRRDGNRCVYCGTTSGPFDIDHVVPWSRGGRHSVENLVVSCRKCNLKKSNRTPQEMGWTP